MENTEEICKMCKTGKSADDGDGLEMDICPFCEKNRLEFGEEKCASCLKKANFVAKYNENI